MLQKISPDGKMMHIFAQGEELATVMGKDRDATNKRVYTRPAEMIQEVATISDPVLMTDYAAIAQIPDYLTRETVFMLYTKPVRNVAFDGYTLVFEQRSYLSLRGPSIDTIFCSRALQTYDMTNFRTIAEVGCGTWFIARYLLSKTPTIQKVYLNDINTVAEKYYNDFPLPDERGAFVLGDAKTFLWSQKVDMLVCNPPYIPRPHSIDDNPYEGLSLLYYLVSSARNYLNPGWVLILNISSLTLHYFQKFIADAWLQATLLDTMSSPLKVFTILHNPDWMMFLQQKCWLQEKDHRWHKRRHDILVYEVRV